MHTVKQIIFVSMLVCARLTTAAAQESTSSSAQRSSLTITAAAAGERVRITAPSSVVQMHVEVYAPGGEKLFDQEIRGGNVFDWHLQDGQAQRLASGVYVCVVTAKSISGRLTQKIGTVTVAENSASVQPAESPQLSVQQTQAIGPVEENSSWTIPGSDEPQTPTVIADDGTDGQMIRGRGALTFRIGNFFSGLDQEQMRLTEAGNLGIGTSEPKAKLDVAGAIRAQQGLVFSNGSTLNVSDKGALTLTSDSGTVTPNIAGTGTQNKIAKWKDNAGTLEDSGITETDSGFVGIGIPNPDGPLIVQGTIPTLLGHMSAIRTTGSNNGFGLLMDAAGSGNNNLGFAVNGVRKASFAWDNSRNFLGFVNFNYSANDFGLRLNSDGSLSFNDGNSSAERFRVTSAGNVGIGTPAPQQNLSVNAALNVDQAGLNNGSFNPGITFGSFSGEGISSQRTGGVAGVLNGLNFFTNSINRMSILHNGNVGIGTTGPGAPLEVQVAAGQSLQFRQDSGLVPGINVKTTGGLAGIMRLRNAVEVWPSDDATLAGKVDVRDTSGFPTITLDGQTGVASFRNMPGINFSQAVDSGNAINPGLSPVQIDSVTIKAPAAGFIFLTAFVYATTPEGGSYLFDFTLSNGGSSLVNTKAQSHTSNFASDGQVPIHLSWVFPVNAGTFQLNTVLYYDDFGAFDGPATVKSHNLTAIYLPVQY